MNKNKETLYRYIPDYFLTKHDGWLGYMDTIHAFIEMEIMECGWEHALNECIESYNSTHEDKITTDGITEGDWWHIVYEGAKFWEDYSSMSKLIHWLLATKYDNGFTNLKAYADSQQAIGDVSKAISNAEIYDLAKQSNGGSLRFYDTDKVFNAKRIRQCLDENMKYIIAHQDDFLADIGYLQYNKRKRLEQ